MKLDVSGSDVPVICDQSPDWFSFRLLGLEFVVGRYSGRVTHRGSPVAEVSTKGTNEEMAAAAARLIKAVEEKS